MLTRSIGFFRHFHICVGDVAASRLGSQSMLPTSIIKKISGWDGKSWP